MNAEGRSLMIELNKIDLAKWEEDEFGALNLYVKDSSGKDVHCWMTLRPTYCDRGHIQLNIEGIRGLDEQDMFPRYFFSFDEANRHCKTFLKWRLWKHRTCPPGS